MKGIDYITETNTVHFYLSTHPSEKLVFALSGTRTLVSLGRVVQKPVNVKPGLNVNWGIIFSCLKLFSPLTLCVV